MTEITDAQETPTPEAPLHQARPVWPMNEEHEPIDWPRALPSTLSEDAQIFYNRVQSGRPLKSDPFEKKQRTYDLYREAPAGYFTPSDRVIAAAAELEAVGLGRLERDRYGYTYITKVSEHYTVAEGRGTQLIHVYIIDEESLNKVLLAVLVGGDLESRSEPNPHSGIQEISVRARHATATDEEHDAASTALLKVSGFSAPAFSGYGLLSFRGFLTEAHLYGLGVDPLRQGEFDPKERCDDEGCDGHPFAPYLPPKIRLPKGTVVEVECLPYRPYLVAQD